MFPAMATLLAVIIVAHTMAISLIRRVFTPSDLASSSERERRLIFHERATSTTKLTRRGTAIRESSSKPTPEREPIRKYVMAGSTLLGSETSFTKLVPEENNDDTTIPTSIRESVCSLLTLVATM